jgi:hypothetical protein
MNKGGSSKMEITARGLWTLIHGMGFGALYLLACSGALVELYRFTTSSEFTVGQERFLRFYLITMVVLAWASVLIGAYVVYPWSVQRPRRERLICLCFRSGC